MFETGKNIIMQDSIHQDTSCFSYKLNLATCYLDLTLEQKVNNIIKEFKYYFTRRFQYLRCINIGWEKWPVL